MGIPVIREHCIKPRCSHEHQTHSLIDPTNECFCITTHRTELSKCKTPPGRKYFQPAHHQGCRKYYQLHPHPLQKRKSCSRDGTFHLNSYLVNNAATLHSQGRLGKPPPLLSWDSFTAAERNPVPASKHSRAFSAQLPTNTHPLSGSVDARIMMITQVGPYNVIVNHLLHSRRLLGKKSAFHSFLWLNNIPL